MFSDMIVVPTSASQVAALIRGVPATADPSEGATYRLGG